MDVNMDEKNLVEFPICPFYLKETAIFSNGDVTPCCTDVFCENKLGRCDCESFDSIYERIIKCWHKDNVDSNIDGREWKSPFCRDCISSGRGITYGAKRFVSIEEKNDFMSASPSYPHSLTIEPTTVCNYKCYGCVPLREKIDRDKFMSLAMFERHIAPHIKRTESIRFYGYGEPFLHPDILEFMRSLRNAAPKANINISSNAMLMGIDVAEALVQNRINSVLISLHGGHTQEHLEKFADFYHESPDLIIKPKSTAKGAPNIEIIADNIRNLVRLKRERKSPLPWISLKVLISAWNDSSAEMDGFLEWAKPLGVDFAGWDDILSEEEYRSRRVAPGTPAYDAMNQRRLHQKYFSTDAFPVWPANEWAPSIIADGDKMTEELELKWRAGDVNDINETDNAVKKDCRRANGESGDDETTKELELKRSAGDVNNINETNDKTESDCRGTNEESGYVFGMVQKIRDYNHKRIARRRMGKAAIKGINVDVCEAMPAVAAADKQIFMQEPKRLKDRYVEYVETATGKYYLPADAVNDIIARDIKNGLVFERAIYETAAKFIMPDTAVLDIGSNFGQMALMMSRHVGEKGVVHAFEADPFLFEIIAANVKINQARIVPHRGAVHHTGGETLYFPEQDLSGPFQTYGMFGIDYKHGQGRPVPAIAVDDLDFALPISFMKIDIQGGDLFAMRGAGKTIGKHRMPIIFEYEYTFEESQDLCFQDYVDFVREIDYVFHRVILAHNFLILPKERANRHG